MAKKDASIINSLETKLKELKESKETAKKDASIIPSLKIKLKESEEMAKKDATIILSLEKQLKESKLVITEKEKKMKETLTSFRPSRKTSRRES